MATMTNLNDTPHSAQRRHSKLNFLSVLILCTTSSFLTASIILIYQYKQGIPFSMAVSLLIAFAFALLVPLLITIVIRAYSKKTLYGPYLTFLIANFVISLTLGYLIF
ncbi:MAG: hypothetical protein HKN70_14285 [Gammaproteobacteria bacterium]|nr:hypothetical protein [Gammaproteobacteria bacterium]